MPKSPKRLPVEQYVSGVLAGNRAVLARAITLIESRRHEDQLLAQQVLNLILPYSGKSIRIGITGSPGVGKSTLLDRFGMLLTGEDRKVAVLAIDPSSALGGGSILGDKTRMENLAKNPNAFIRPSPTGGTLGGVARKTRETLLLCEAAGFDVVIIETVGVGQSEIQVADMVDCFVALLLPGGGDELQGIKKGLLEMADIIGINKADGDNLVRAKITQGDHQAALKYLRSRRECWPSRVLLLSGLNGVGLSELWELILMHRETLIDAGEFDVMRKSQRRRWMWALVREGLLKQLLSQDSIREIIPQLEGRVDSGDMNATAAALEILNLSKSGNKQ